MRANLELPPPPTESLQDLQAPKTPRTEPLDISADVKSQVLVEALPYLLRYRDQTFVVKYGGSFMDDPNPDRQEQVVRDIVFLEAVGINPVVVHGGGKAITKAFQREGLEATFINGERVTTPQGILLVDNVLSYEINPGIVAMIEQLGGKAKSIPGPEVFTCRKQSFPPERDLGLVGEIVHVNVAKIEECIVSGTVPVISPTARDENGQIYNCNADIAAAEVAAALKAKRLVFMSDVPGLMTNKDDPSTLITETTAQNVHKLMEDGVIQGGMIPKLRSALAACEAGVENVSLVDGRTAHAILLEIFTRDGIGTIIHNKPQG